MERSTIHIPNRANGDADVERVVRSAQCDEKSIGVGRSARAAKLNPPREGATSAGVTDASDSSVTSEPNEQSVIDGIAALQQQLTSLQERKVEEIEQIYETLTDIGLKVAEKLLIRAADDNRLSVETLVREVVELCGEPTQLVVKVHPDDAVVLAAHLTGDESFTVEPDSQLNRGECVADTGQFVASLRWGNRLAEIRQEMMESLNDSLS